MSRMPNLTLFQSPLTNELYLNVEKINKHVTQISLFCKSISLMR